MNYVENMRLFVDKAICKHCGYTYDMYSMYNRCPTEFEGEGFQGVIRYHFERGTYFEEILPVSTHKEEPYE